MCVFCFCAHKTNTLWLTHLYGILTSLLFFKQRCLLSSLKPPSLSVSFLFSSLHLSVFLSVCSPFLPVSGLGSLAIFYPWATRPFDLGVISHLYYQTTPTGEMCISDFLWNKLWVCLFVCMHACVLVCLSHYYMYEFLQRVLLYLFGLIFYVFKKCGFMYHHKLNQVAHTWIKWSK